MYKYDYQIAVIPRIAKKDAIFTPIAFTAFVYGVADKDAALRAFWSRHMVIARKNGIQRGKNQFRRSLLVVRTGSHKILKRARKRAK